MHALKIYLRSKLIACQSCYQRYQQLKYQLKNLLALRFCFHDLKNVSRHMYWGNEASLSKQQLQAKLLFYYHKIEKGICMPGRKRLFALDVIPRVMSLMEVWESNGNSRSDPIYLGALSSIKAYKDLLASKNLDINTEILPKVIEFLAQRDTITNEQETPITISNEQIDAVIRYDEFSTLCQIRRSFRDFSDQDVSDDAIQRAVELAQLSPSACNRQPCKVYLVRDNVLKQKLLSHQNGNMGFGHLAPVVMAITTNMSHFFGPIERHQPYIDGGLFSMTLLYSLQTQGVVSCCLNWCVTPASDRRAHELLSIPDSERIVMLVVAGYPAQRTLVPHSQRKALDSVLVYR